MLLVVEAGDTAVAAARSQACAAGLEVRDGWEPGADPSRVVCTGVVRTAEDAAAAVYAAVRGAGLIVDARAPREVVDRVCDDLRRLGPFEHRLSGGDEPTALPADQRELLVMLAQGMSLGEAATRLSVSRRTADRRLAAARCSLGVATTTEAILALSNAGSERHRPRSR